MKPLRACFKLKTLVQRTRVQLTRVQLYNYKIINKTQEEVALTLRLLGDEGEIRLIGNQEEIPVPEGGTAQGSLFILMPKSSINKASQKLKVGVFKGEEQLETLKAKFMGPVGIH